MPEVLYRAEVEWVDSTGTEGWHDPQQASENLDRSDCRAVGHVLVDDDRGIVLALSIGGAGQVLDSMAIPRVAIGSITRLADEVTP